MPVIIFFLFHWNGPFRKAAYEDTWKKHTCSHTLTHTHTHTHTRLLSVWSRSVTMKTNKLFILRPRNIVTCPPFVFQSFHLRYLTLVFRHCKAVGLNIFTALLQYVSHYIIQNDYNSFTYVHVWWVMFTELFSNRFNCNIQT